MKKRKLNISLIENKMKEQLRFLMRSCDLFDSGYSDEAKRITVTLRNILHNKNTSKSLLNQLGLLGLRFIDTSDEYIPGSINSYTGLILMENSPTDMRFIPKLDNIPNNKTGKLNFERWWNKAVIIDDNKNVFSRKKIILTIADQDGGAHVDNSVDEDYATLIYDNSIGWKKVTKEGKKPMEGIEKATVRQIAHEVLQTMMYDYPEKKQINKNSIIFGEIYAGDKLPSKIFEVDKTITTYEFKIFEIQMMADKLIADNKYNDALSYIISGLNIDKNNTELLYMKGFCLAKIKDFDNAVSVYENLLKIKNDHFSAISCLLELYILKKSFSKYYNLYEKNKLNVEKTDNGALNAFYNILISYMEDDFEGMINFFQDYISKLSSNIIIKLFWSFDESYEIIKSFQIDKKRILFDSFVKLVKGEIRKEDIILS